MGTSCSLCLRHKDATDAQARILSELRIAEAKKTISPAEVASYFAENKASMPAKLQSLYRKVLDDSYLAEKTVDLRFTNLRQKGIKHLSVILPFYHNLTILKLWKTGLGPEGLLALKDILPIFRLEVLSLEDNCLGPQGAFLLCSLFVHLKTLKELWIQINSVGLEGGRALAEDLHLLKSLKIAAFDENDLCDDGVRALTMSLASLPSITTVTFTSNFLTKACLADVIKRVQKITHLKKVDLKGNVTEEEADELIREMGKVDAVVLK